MSDRQQCRHRLNELLRAEYDCAGRLQSILQSEAEALVTRNLDALEQLVGEKHQLMQRFEQLDCDKHQLLKSHGYGVDQAGIEACIAWCDATGQLLRGWKSLMERVSHCQQLNRVNGVTLDASRRHAQHALNILRGQSPLPDLYSPAGMTSQPGSAGRSLAKA